MQRLLLLDSPVGRLGITASEAAVTGLFFHSATPARAIGTQPCTPSDTPKLLQQAAHQIEEYFAGKRSQFSFPIAPAGTPFQQAVWEALRTIPLGQTRTYKQIATQIGRPAACRAVGMANNRNPIAIVIPCHRVVGADGSLTGYAGGLEVKQRLLSIEK